MLCPHCAAEVSANQPACPECGWRRPIHSLDPLQTTLTDGWHDADGSEPINTSGSDLPPPLEVREMGFCWGALGMPELFAWANRIPWGFGGLWAGIPFYGRVAYHGHVLAWQSRRFAGFKQFERTMRIWNRWGIAAFGFRLVLFLLVFVSVVSALLERPQPPATAAQANATLCSRNLQRIAHACIMYSYDWDDRLPQARSWQPALAPLLPDPCLLVCPDGPTYRFNPNVSGSHLPSLPRFVALVYEADSRGNLAYVHACGCGTPEANVGCTQGEACGECQKHPGRVNWWGKPPPGTIVDTNNNSR